MRSTEITARAMMLGLLLAHPICISCNDGDPPAKDAAIPDTAARRDSRGADLTADASNLPDKSADSKVIEESNLGKGCQKNSDCFPDAPDSAMADL